MHWLFFAGGTVLSYALFDFCLKMLANRMHSGMANILVNAVALGVGILYFYFAKMQGEDVSTIKQGGILFAVAAGVVVSFAGIFFVKMLSTDVPLSTGVAVVRIGAVILAVILAAVLLRERMNIQHVAGFVLALLGLYLVITAK